MKNLFLLLTTTILFACVSCNNGKTEDTASDATSSDKKGSSLTEKNLAANRAVVDAFMTGNTAGLDSFIAPDFLDHSMGVDKKGIDSLKAMIAMTHADGTDMKMETIKDLADDEYVMSWLHFTGISKGAMGKPGPYDMHAIEVTKFKDGKAIEHWSYMDPVETMKMMSSMPPPPAKGKK